MAKNNATTALGEDIRSQFPIFGNRVYLNSCSQGALSDSVREAYESYLDGLATEGSQWDLWMDNVERVRGAFAQILHTAPANVAVIGSASAGVNAVASALDYTERSTVVTTSLEFPTIGQIWRAQERRGAKVVEVAEEPDGTLSLERLSEAIDERTAIVSVTQVCYRNGSRLDIDAIAKLAHERGALLLVDAYQATGAVPVDVSTSAADFVVGGSLKYLLGSPGVAYLYANPETTGHLVPTSTGWLADQNIGAMQISRYQPASDARRFEAGTPAVPALFAAIAGIELMLGIGIERTAAHVNGLNDKLIDEVLTLGGKVATPHDRSRRGPLIAIVSSDAELLVQRLATENIVTSSRGGNLRVSAHCYNTDADIDKLLAVLQKNRILLKPH
ncbi:MAG TPA: aminotransferase class V-fold PLP-dependent enzyme [Jatrophihabitans sp.]|jgi:selenocysteine lyase/cysteine desulfurase